MSYHSSLSAQGGYATHPRMIIRRIFSILLYFVGAIIAWFGLLGTALYIPGSNNRVGYIVLVIGIIIFIGSLIYFFRVRYKAPCLPWLHYLWWILGATIGIMMAFALLFAIAPDANGNSQSIPNTLLASSIFLYGVTLIIIAHLEPSLRYQIHESIRKVLKATPGKQMILSDLLSRLQREYPCSEATLDQYVGNLKYIEQMAIPGTPTKLCRIKGTQEAVTFPQVYSIMTNDLRQHVARALQFLNEENIDIGLFLLSKEFEATLKAHLIAANAKGLLSTIPGNKNPAKLPLPEMISCAKNNGIITDDAALSLLRQGRNERAHGTMPSLAERQLLMKSVQYIAGLYIDYINFLDGLTHSL